MECLNTLADCEFQLRVRRVTDDGFTTRSISKGIHDIYSHINFTLCNSMKP